jgi:hypothetical protein
MKDISRREMDLKIIISKAKLLQVSNFFGNDFHVYLVAAHCHRNVHEPY